MKCDDCRNYRVKMIPVATCQMGEWRTHELEKEKFYNFLKHKIVNSNTRNGCRSFEEDSE